MSESTLPQPEIDETKSFRLRVAQRYIELGWPVFILGEDKRPVANCFRCSRRRNANFVWHNEDDCPCLMCHGFYAATLDDSRVARMLENRPSGLMAVRTGGLSRLLVIDAEAHADPNAGDGLTGLDVVDQWESWTGFELSPTLRQRSGSGGLHIVFRKPVGMVIRSSPRILPQVDLKADGGYIVIADGMEPRRHWIDPIESLADAPAQLLEWITQRKVKLAHREGMGGGGGGHGGRGGFLSPEEFASALRDGVKGGQREPFFAQLSFSLRKRGASEAEIEAELRYHWERCEQPSGDYFHWSYVEYKIDRDRHIKPDVQVTSSMKAWATSVTTSAPRERETYRKVGRVTLAPRRSQ